MSKMNLIAAAAAILVVAPVAAHAADSNATFSFSGGQAVTLTYNGTNTVQATDQGWVDQNGNNNGGGSFGNYISGVCGSSDSCNGDDVSYNDYFTFDLTGAPTITSAFITLPQSDGGFISDNPSLVYTLFDTTQTAASIDQASGTSVYNDLESGVSYGSAVVTPASNGGVVTIDLDAAALSAINAGGGEFALGGSVGSVSAAPEPGTWALMFAGVAMIGGALRLGRKRGVGALSVA